MIPCYSVSLLLSNITLTLLVLQGGPDWLNSINYSCVIKNLYQNNNFVLIFMIFLNLVDIIKTIWPKLTENASRRLIYEVDQKFHKVSCH